MLLFLLAVSDENLLDPNCTIYNLSCLKCIHLSGGRCSFCRTDSFCYLSDSPDANNCTNIEENVTTKCVEELGGDAKPSVRLAIGLSVVIIGISVDLVVRYIYYLQNRQARL
jgi:hypothetical protein